MALFVWQDIYSVGIEHIDAQHRTLFGIANRFHDAYARRAPRAELTTIFGELMEYTVSHFNDEERLMQAHRYSDFDRHKASHEKLIQLVRGYRQQLDTGTPGVEENAMNFVKTWLNGHVLGMDRSYKDYVQPARAVASMG